MELPTAVSAPSAAGTYFPEGAFGRQGEALERADGAGETVAILGLCAAAAAAAARLLALGHSVICAQLDGATIAALLRGGAFEPAFPHPATVRQALRRGRLIACAGTYHAVRAASTTLVCVPHANADGGFDAKRIESACRIAGHAIADSERYHTIAVHGPIAVGTSRARLLPRLERASGKRAGVDFGYGVLAHGAPPAGGAPRKMVIGGIDPRSVAGLRRLFADAGDAVPGTSVEIAEAAAAAKSRSSAMTARPAAFAGQASERLSA